MTTRAQTLVLYGLAVSLLGAMLGLHFAASRANALPIRIRVERLDASVLRRTYQIELEDRRNGLGLRDANVLVITQPHGASRSEITVVATETDQAGVYRASVPFSHEGDWYVHVALNEPIGVHRIVAEKIQGDIIGAPIPVFEAEGEPEDEFSLRTLANGYAFLLHLSATFVLGLALALLFISRRATRTPTNGSAAWGTQLFWAATLVLLGTGLYNFVYHTISPAPVPLTLDLTETWRQFTVQNYGDAYAILLAAKHLAILALIGAGAALTLTLRTMRQQGAARSHVIQFGVSALAVVLGILIVLLGGMLVYLHGISEH